MMPFSPDSPLFDDPVFQLPDAGAAGPAAQAEPQGLLDRMVPTLHAASAIRPARVAGPVDAGGTPPRTQAVRVSMEGGIGGEGEEPGPAAQAFPIAQLGAPLQRFPGVDGEAVPAPDLFVSAAELSALRARRDGLRRQIADARRSTGDQVAGAALGIDRDLEQLRMSYPSRVQMSFYWNPELPPLAPPFWLYGLWHDTDNTFIRLLAPEPVFRDEVAGVEIEPVAMDTYLYRLPGVIDHGSVTVRSGRGYVRAFWTRVDETEGGR